MSVAFEEVETGLPAIRSELDRAAKDKSKRALRPSKGFAAHLERIEEAIEPEIPADCVGLEKDLIGGDRSQRRDAVPPKFRVLVTRGPKYVFRGSDGVVQALAPAHLIESGLPFTGRRRSICAMASRTLMPWMSKPDVIGLTAYISFRVQVIPQVY